MKKTVFAVAGVAAFAGVAMPVAGVFAASTDTRQVTDSLNVTVNDTCTMTNTYAAGTEGNAWGTKASGTANEYAADSNTWTVAMNNSDTKTSPKHTVAITCNKTTGWKLNAQNAANLTTNENKDNIKYNASAAAGTEGYYVNIAKTAGEEKAVISTDNISGGKMNDLSSESKTIFSQDGSTSTAAIELSYTVATSSTTEAGTYTGNIVYTLAPNA